MNKRILKIFNEAGFHQPEMERSGIEHKFEKFAELIVRECIDIVSPYALRMENFDGGHPITDLKKHFGVE